MDRGAFATLVALDIRRFRGLLFRGVTFTVGALTLFALGGHRDAETVTAVLLGASAYYLLWPPMSAVNDRLQGGFELLTSLPLGAGLVAGARMTGIALAVVPVAVHAAVGFVLYLGPALGVDPDPLSAGSLFVLAWALSSGAGAVAAGVIVRWGVDGAGRWPAMLFALGLILVVVLGERFEATVTASLSELLARGGVPLVLALAAGALAVVTHVVGYRLIRGGLEAFRPERDRLRA